MARLDLEEKAALEPLVVPALDPAEVLSYLRSLHAMWTATGTEGRQAFATSIFARMDVQGFKRMEYELTEDAIRLGLNEAVPAVLELGGSFAESGRGERDSPATNDLPITMRLAEPPVPLGLVRSA